LVPTGFFANFLSGSTGITGWTVVGPEISMVSGTYASLGFTFPAEDGKQAARKASADGTPTRRNRGSGFLILQGSLVWLGQR
jgi:hypothetical protein